MIKKLALKTTPNKILLITLRHLGDTILTTPLLSTLDTAFPSAQIDVLAYKNTASILENNPSAHQIITVTNQPSINEYKALLIKIFRQYDLVVATHTGDRPFIYSLLASSTRLSVVPQRTQKGWWKRYFLQGWSEFDDSNTHTVLQLLTIADIINVNKIFHLTPPDQSTDLNVLPKTSKNYAVIHIYPLWTYKQWTKSGWLEVAKHLIFSDITVVLTGGPNPDEIKHVSEFQQLLPKCAINLAGKTSLAELTHIIQNAQLFIGPDTGTTHLAAATGTPTIAIYGPTNPIKWAPWPINYNKDQNPFQKTGNQVVNNVYLIQGQAPCVPCHLEGCERHRQSRSDCLDNLPASEVIKIINAIIL